MYTCPRHQLDLEGVCPECMKEFENRAPANTLTPEQRLELYDAIPDVLTIPYPCLKKWIFELVGRPVYTHELIDTESLRREILSGKHPETIDEITTKFPAHVKVEVLDLRAQDTTPSQN